MYRKLLVSIAILVDALFSFMVCFANDNKNPVQDAANGVRNVVGNAENTVENAAKDISNTSKNATGNLEKGANNVGTTATNKTNDGVRNNNYTATRTATGTTFMGMNGTSWTWLIIGIAAIAIIALVWYYSMQVRSSNYDDRD